MFTKTLQIAGITGVLTFGTVGPAYAADAYMGGLFGTTPGYNTITGPNGERISTSPTWLGGDERIRWNNISQSSAERAQIKWLEEHQGEQNTIWVYSATANSINNVINTRPDLFTNTTVIAIAPPKVGSAGYQQVKAPSTAKVYQVIVDGDSVADEDGTSFSTHTDGYRDLNLQTAEPISATTLNGTNTKRSYYQRPVKPKSTFNLFDIRTWFPQSTTVRRAAPPLDQTQPSGVVDSSVGSRTDDRRSGNAGGQDTEEGRTVGGSPEREDRKNLLGSGQRGTRVDSSAGDDDGTTGAGNDGSASVSGDKKRGSNDGE